MTDTGRALLTLLAPVPALVIGVLLMQRSGVSSAIWGQQLGAGLVLFIICAALVIARPDGRRPRRPRTTWIVGSIALLLLIATLFHPGVEGVRRWVSLGPLQLYAAFIALPVLTIVFDSIIRSDVGNRSSTILLLASAITSTVLACQPDASQAIAFGVAIAIMLLPRRSSVSSFVAIGIVIVGAIIAVSRPDPLDAVPHVEGIVRLAAGAGAGWLIAAAVALLLLPLPFAMIAGRAGEVRGVSLGLAAYFGTVCIASLVAPYPVPLLGFGLSPIVGYFAALVWIVLREGSANSIRNTHVPARICIERS